MKRVFWSGFVAAAAVLCGVAVAQQEYKSESGSWRFVCPAEWNPIGFDVIKADDAQAREEFPDKTFTYIAGFTMGPMNTKTYPYILINKTDVDLSGITFDELDEALRMQEPDNERDLDLLLLGVNFTAEPGSLDRSRLRVTGYYDDTDAQGKEYHATLYTFLGKTQSLQFECYDLKSSASQNVAAFREFVDSFSMRDDLKFVAATGAGHYDKSNYKDAPRRYSSGGRSWRYSGWGIGVMVVLGLLKVFTRSMRN